MRAGVDAEREARNDTAPGGTEFRRETRRESTAVRSRGAGADDRDARPAKAFDGPNTPKPLTGPSEAPVATQVREGRVRDILRSIHASAITLPAAAGKEDTLLPIDQGGTLAYPNTPSRNTP